VLFRPQSDERRVRFHLGDRDYFVEGMLWYGPDDTYFKVRADDGNLYILRYKLAATEDSTLKLSDDLCESDAPMVAHIH
jgi:hypothetical protein